MIVFGEKFNSSVKSTYDMIASHDVDALIELAKKQEKEGADYLDINTAMFVDRQEETMAEIIDIVRQNTLCGIMIDTPDAGIAQKMAERTGDRDLIFNSITLSERKAEILPLVREKGAGVICLPIDEDGMPEGVEGRKKNISRFIDELTAEGIDPDKVFMDVIIETLSVKNDAAAVACETIRWAKQTYPKMHVTCGLSNISFGLPGRPNINAAFLTGAIMSGLDSAIMDITSPVMKNALITAEAVAGRDDYCMRYMDHILNADTI